jgi:hypothetical protein
MNNRKADPPGELLSVPSNQIYGNLDERQEEEEEPSSTENDSHVNDGLLSDVDGVNTTSSLGTQMNNLLISKSVEAEAETEAITSPIISSPLQPPPLPIDLPIASEADNANATTLQETNHPTVVQQQQEEEKEEQEQAVPVPEDEPTTTAGSPDPSMDLTQLEAASGLSQSQDNVDGAAPAPAPPLSLTTSTTDPTIAGAYRVTKSRPPGTTAYRVRVPLNVQPGSDFTVEIPAPVSENSSATGTTGNASGSSRRVQITCPVENTIPGTTDIEIEVPHAATYLYHPLKAAQLTIAPTTSPKVAGQAFPMLPNIEEINQRAVKMGGTIRTRVITIPENALPGQEFSCPVGATASARQVDNRQKGRKLKIKCPPNCRPGDRIRIELPPELPEPEPLYQTFLIVVPYGVTGGGRFAVGIGLNNQQVLVDCPVNAISGDTLSIQLPTRTVVDKFQALSYPSTGTGWKRTVRASDLHFQWVRLNESIVEPPKTAASPINALPGATNSSPVIPPMPVADWRYYRQMAFVRHLVHLEGNDPRLRTASVALVPAETASVHSKLKTEDGELLFSYADIAYQQSQPLNEKHNWFLEICKQMNEYASTNATDSTNSTTRGDATAAIDVFAIRILVRRDLLLSDSLRALLSLSATDMRRSWEIQFVGESGKDQGGLTKEWFQCVTEEIFNPNFGLFVSSLNNQAAVDVNPVSGTSNSYYFRCGDFLHSLTFFLFVERKYPIPPFNAHLR